MCTGPHPFIPFAGHAKVEVRALWDLQQVENVLYFRQAGDYDAAALNGLATALISAWRTNILPLQAAGVTYATIKATAMHTETGAQIEVPFNTPNVGTRTGSILPNNVTVAVKFATGLAGRSARGRAYHIGLTASQVAVNRLNAADVTAIQNGYMAMRNAMVTAGHTLVVASLCHNNAWRTAGVSYDVLAVTVNAVVDSQRRRLPERGS